MKVVLGLAVFAPDVDQESFKNGLDQDSVSQHQLTLMKRYFLNFG